MTWNAVVPPLIGLFGALLIYSLSKRDARRASEYRELERLSDDPFFPRL